LTLAEAEAEAFAAVSALDARRFEAILHAALVTHGRTAVMQQVLVPLINRIGDAWQTGELRVAHEHVASAVIRTFLGNFTRSHSLTVNAPALLVTTPAGQLHELGALLVAAAASDQGWEVGYLGPNLPPEEIAGACSLRGARAVAISIVYPEDDPTLAGQLRLLRELLPAEIAIIAGGRAAPHYASALREIGAAICHDIPAFLQQLSEARARRSTSTPRPPFN
jgi:methanogenic corrinoid protein MtbC1